MKQKSLKRHRALFKHCCTFLIIIMMVSRMTLLGNCSTDLFLSTAEGIYMKLPPEVLFAITTAPFDKKTIVEHHTMQLLLRYLKEMHSIEVEHPRYVWTKKIAALALTTKPEELISLIDLAASLQQIEIAHGIARQYVDQELSHAFYSTCQIPEQAEQILRKQYFLRTKNRAVLSYVSTTSHQQITLSFSLREIFCTTKTPIFSNKLDLAHLHIGSLEGIQALNSPLIFNLDLSYNEIEEIPEDIGALTYLTHLNLSFNRLKKLPDSIGNLLNLIRFDVHHNLLTQLPSTIERLGKLERFDCSYNFLKEVSPELFSVSQRASLTLVSHHQQGSF